MNLTKNQWIIVAVVAAVAIWYFFLRKKDDVKESNYRDKLGPKSTTGTSGTTGGSNRTLSYCVCPVGFLSTSTGWVKNAQGDKVSCYCAGSEKVVSGNVG